MIFGQLGAEPDACALYAKLEKDPAFEKPLSWKELSADDYDALIKVEIEKWAGVVKRAGIKLD